MTKFILSTLTLGLLMALPNLAQAKAFDNSDDGNYTYPNVNLTGYSAACRHDHYGGRNESSADSRLKPRSHTLDGTSVADNVVVTAVPQIKGTASLYRCFYKIIPPANAPADLKAMMAKKVFFAGDHYGSGSNRKMKIDVSYACTPKVQIRSYAHAKIKRLNCLGRKDDVVAAVNQVASIIAMGDTQIADAGNMSHYQKYQQYADAGNITPNYYGTSTIQSDADAGR